MEVTVREVVQVRPMSTDEKRRPAPSDVDVLREQRIRFDGYFTGPTW
ncbi:MAG TPA: hypothetical protein VER34_16680 [Mycobacterium sp.]|jgi:hypothetical protein|nr:hypothetical protein [Mycobacterium sp.]